jgi:hypothetical protein
MLEHEDAAATGVINCAACSDGHRVADLPLSDVRAGLGKGDRFVWIGLFEPHGDVLRLVQQEFGLHDLAIEDALTAHQRPKLEQYDGSLFVVLRTAQLSGAEGLELGETHVFVGPRCVISYAMVRSRPTWVFAPGARLFRTFADLGRAERAFQTARRLGRHHCRPDDDCRDLWNELRQDAGTALAPWLPDGHDPDRRRLRITFRRFQKFGVALTSTETRQVRVLTVRPRATTISARSTPF